jgi:molecular chaperone DnaK (HSP70)
VFDLGGGTFDVSVVDSRLGDYDVQATDGCILGGDNFDENIRKWAIKEGLIKVHRLTAADLAHLKWDCAKLKIRVQQSRMPEILDLSPYGAGHLTLNPDTYVELMKLTFSEAIIKAKKVLGEAVPEGEPYSLIMVGGSTRCPFLQEWVAQEMGQAPVPMFYDPDRIVAQGAALYGQMLADGTANTQVSDVTKALSIELVDGSARILIPRNSKIPVQETTVVFNAITADKMRVKLYQGDSLLASQNELIGELMYDYGEVRRADDGEVIVGIIVEANGTIRFSCKELLKPPVEVVLSRTQTSI